jgi:hypothetical protein
VILVGQDSEKGKKRQVSELGKKARDLYDQAMTAKEERRKQFLELAKSQETKQERERFLREFVISPEISHALAGTIEASGSHLRGQYNIQPPDFERLVQDISTQIQTRIPQVDLSDETIDKLAQSQLKTLNSFEQQREKKGNIG